jgi:small subunit ribosomal protein S1
LEVLLLTSEDPEGGTLNKDEPQSMAALLEQETTPYTELRRGDIVEGAVVGTDRDGILVDIGAKSEGVIPANEMHSLQPEGSSKLQVGEKVLVFVVQPESPDGQIILSLDRARGEQGWRVLQEYMDQNQAFEGYVTGSNKGGLLVNVEGVNAFIPLSQIAIGRPERGDPETTERALAEWIGRTLTLKVIELNRRRNRAIVSERAAMQEKRAAEKERLLQELNEGDVRNGTITSIRDFGIFVDVGGADGLVHLSELSWERTPKSPNDLFNIGDEVEVYVLKVDQESKKIALSLRRAQPEKWEEMVAGFREGQIVPGQVTKLAPFGAFVRLDGPIEGLIHISELVDRRINHPKEIVDEEGVVPVKIVRIEHDRHRLGLSLRQARDKAEEDGWVFNDTGGVITGPEEVYAKLGMEAPPRPEVEAAAEKPEAEAEPEAEPELGAMEAAMKAAEAEAAEVIGAEAEPEAATEEPQAESEAKAEAEEAVEEEAAAVEESETEEATESEAKAEAEEAAEEEAAAVEESETEEATESEAKAEAEEAAEEEAAAVEESETEEATESEAKAEAEEAVEEEAAAVEESETEEDAEPEATAEEAEAETEEATESEAEPEAEEETVEAEEPQAEAEVEEAVEPDATAEEAGEEEAETASESEIEDEPTVTEDAPDALNKEKDSSAEVESEADEASEPAKDETSD